MQLQAWEYRNCVILVFVAQDKSSVVPQTTEAKRAFTLHCVLQSLVVLVYISSLLFVTVPFRGREQNIPALSIIFSVKLE